MIGAKVYTILGNPMIRSSEARKLITRRIFPDDEGCSHVAQWARQ
jgi:hypothetical protein